MNSPEADSSPVFETDDATTESTLIDHIACVTETSDISKADAKDDDGINQLLNRAQSSPSRGAKGYGCRVRLRGGHRRKGRRQPERHERRDAPGL